MEVALGDRYRKFYRTLKNAKQNFQFNVQFKILSKIFIPNFIHSNSSQKYSYKDFMTQGKIKVMNCSKFGEKIKLPQNANKGCKYCQNIGPWWYSSCFNAKCSPKVPKYGILLTRVGFSLFSLFFFTKSGQTKTHFFQCFLMMWPILRGTMWKLTSWGFRKWGTFWDLDLLYQSYRCPKLHEISTKYFKKCHC